MTRCYTSDLTKKSLAFTDADFSFNIEYPVEMPKSTNKASNAERQRLFRQRRDADPVRRAQYLEQKRLEYQRYIEAGARKKIAAMGDREKKGSADGVAK